MIDKTMAFFGLRASMCGLTREENERDYTYKLVEIDRVVAWFTQQIYG